MSSRRTSDKWYTEDTPSKTPGRLGPCGQSRASSSGSSSSQSSRSFHRTVSHDSRSPDAPVLRRSLSDLRGARSIQGPSTTVNSTRNYLLVLRGPSPPFFVASPSPNQTFFVVVNPSPNQIPKGLSLLDHRPLISRDALSRPLNLILGPYRGVCFLFQKGRSRRSLRTMVLSTKDVQCRKVG